MKVLLIILVVFLVVTDALSLGLSLGPGLSVKNALLYLIAGALLFRMTLAGNKVQGGSKGLQQVFFVFLIYAIFSWLAAALVVQYPRYELIASGIQLKSTLVDQFLFFLVFFHGTQSDEDARATLKGMLLAVVLVNFITIADVLGLINLGIIEVRDSGRVEGALGEANQYGAFIALFLPAVLAAAAGSRGLWRLIWGGGALICAAALVTTVSRGAFVGLVLAAVFGAYAFRQYLSPQRLFAWLGGALVLMTVVVLALWVSFGDLLVERLFGQSGNVDMGEVTSGRTQIWAAALGRMLESPVTILSGFGWNVYQTMPFHYAPHNHYLGLWFNLGLVGLISGIALLVLPILTAKRAVPFASDESRGQLVAFVFGAGALAVAVFFVDLYRPWWYFWAYAGLVMRMAQSAVQARSGAAKPLPAVAGPGSPSVRTPRRDPFGWHGVGS